MKREEFKKLVTVLTEKELIYQENPTVSASYYETDPYVFKDENGIFVLDASFTNYRTEGHGLIISNQPSISSFRNIILSKQTRFAAVPLHYHNFVEVFYIYKGHCATTINNQKLLLSAGDVCIMDTRTVHSVEAAGHDDIILNCQINKNYFDASFIGRLAASGPVASFLADVLSDDTFHDRFLLFHTTSTPVIHELFINMFCEYLDPGLCSSEVLDSYMTLIFIELARCYQGEKEREYRKNSKKYITEILRYIEDHCTDCTLESVGFHFGFNSTYLSRAIKKTTGHSFKELVDEFRLNNSVFLLLNSEQSIHEIAIQCGWSNQNQFYKKFTTTYGVTPMHYRKSKTNLNSNEPQR